MIDPIGLRRFINLSKHFNFEIDDRFNTFEVETPRALAAKLSEEFDTADTAAEHLANGDLAAAAVTIQNLVNLQAIDRVATLAAEILERRNNETIEQLLPATIDRINACIMEKLDALQKVTKDVGTTLRAECLDDLERASRIFEADELAREITELDSLRIALWRGHSLSVFAYVNSETPIPEKLPEIFAAPDPGFTARAGRNLSWWREQLAQGLDIDLADSVDEMRRREERHKDAELADYARANGLPEDEPYESLSQTRVFTNWEKKEMATHIVKSR